MEGSIEAPASPVRINTETEASPDALLFAFVGVAGLAAATVYSKLSPTRKALLSSAAERFRRGWARRGGGR